MNEATKTLDQEIQELRDYEAIFVLRMLLLAEKVRATTISRAIELAKTIDLEGAG